MTAAETSFAEQRNEQLADADEHVKTAALIDLRAMHVIVDEHDPQQWPPRSQAVWTLTRARIEELLPW